MCLFHITFICHHYAKPVHQMYLHLVLASSYIAAAEYITQTLQLPFSSYVYVMQN